MGHPGARFWHPSEVARLVELRDIHGLSWPEISARMGITVSKLCSKYQSIGRERRTPFDKRQFNGSPRCPDDVLAARERRQIAQSDQDIASAYFGDPPPGYSALDKRRVRA